MIRKSMVENNHYQTLELLKKTFPEFEKQLEEIYRQDSLFKEIAREYYEIVKKIEMNYFETGKKFEVYTDTMNELKEELLDYLNDLKSNDYMFS